jgi:hypothetical protein
MTVTVKRTEGYAHRLCDNAHRACASMFSPVGTFQTTLTGLPAAGRVAASRR